VIPPGEPELGYSSGNSRRSYGHLVLVRIVLGGLGGACLGLYNGGFISGMDESTSARIKVFDEFEILRA
jgi:hypothetical protein